MAQILTSNYYKAIIMDTYYLNNLQQTSSHAFSYFQDLDHFEGRSWISLHHHLTLCFMAYAFLLILQ